MNYYYSEIRSSVVTATFWQRQEFGADEAINKQHGAERSAITRSAKLLRTVHLLQSPRNGTVSTLLETGCS